MRQVVIHRLRHPIHRCFRRVALTLGPAGGTFSGVPETYSLAQAQSRLGDLVSRAQLGCEPVLVTEQGAPVAAIVSMAELAELQNAQDAADLATCQAIKARSGPGMRHDEFMALLEAERTART
jgi:prevent-host-death family protein